MSAKTNAMRVLEAEAVEVEVCSYQLDDDEFSAENAAQALGLPLEQVFKTLVVRGDRSGPMVALLPAGTEIDFKRLAQSTGDKKVEMVPLREVPELTGYERGAVTPLAMPRSYPVFVDETVILWKQVGISAGTKGLEIVLSPDDLLRVTAAKPVDFARSI